MPEGAESMSEVTEKNKEIVREIFDKIVNGGDADLAAKYYQEGYIQHNSDVPQGLAGLQRLIRGMHASGDPMHAEIALMNAEEDMVWVLVEWSGGKLPPGTPRLVRTAEIFRVEDGMMAEHWDVLHFAPAGA
jgi:predicted SnoaL-like aldol condensation-catalyzing enzyme